MASSLPFTGTATVPDPLVPIEETLSRWSYSNVEHPALHVVPEDEGDIILALQHARKHELTVVTSGGGNAAFVPITKSTIYLSLERFDLLQLDQAGKTVAVGGGVRAGRVLAFLAEKGFYAVLPSSNAVGMAGFVLGGGGHHFIGRHGLAVDNVESFRIITADGRAMDLSRASLGEELSLFEVLNGAGLGYGVVTSFTMKVYPLSALGMDNNEFITRRLVFPASEIAAAAGAFSSFNRPSPNLVVGLVSARAPPETPFAGAPLVILDATYTGTKGDAEKETAVLFEDELVKRATMAETTSEPFVRLNNATEGGNTTGGLKDLNVAALKSLSQNTIQEAFSKWLAFTAENEDASRTILAISRYDTTFSEKAQQPGEFVATRDRGTACIAITWFTNPDLRDRVEAFVQDIKTTIRRDDEERPPRTVLNNMRPHTKLGELFEEENIRELRRVKGLWDPENLFWSPWTRDA